MPGKKPNIEIRVAVLEEATSLSKLLYEAFVEYKSLYTEQAFAATVLNIPKIEERIYKQTIWVALDTKVINGTISLMPMNDALYVRSVAVAPAARRRGVGRALMEHAGGQAIKKGFKSIELTTTPFLFDAISLYQSFGFEQCGYEDLYGTQLIKMKKNLNSAKILFSK